MSFVLPVCSESDLAEDFVVWVKGEGGGEGSDVGDERGVLERQRGGRQEGQLAHFTVGRGGGGGGGRVVGAVGAAGDALLRRVVLLHPETNHLPEETNVFKVGQVFFSFYVVFMVARGRHFQRIIPASF